MSLPRQECLWCPPKGIPLIFYAEQCCEVTHIHFCAPCFAYYSQLDSFFKVIHLKKHHSHHSWFQTRGTLHHALFVHICNTYLEQYKSCQCYCPQLYWRAGGWDEAYLMFQAASLSVELLLDVHIYGYCVPLNFCTSIDVEPHVCIFLPAVVLPALPACLYVKVCVALSCVILTTHTHTHTVIYLSLSLLSTLGEAWAQLKKSLADEAEVHLKFSSKVFHQAFLH